MKKLLNKKKAGIAFNPIIWAILGLLVLAVSLSIINLIKSNSDKIDANSLISIYESETDTFVPGDWTEFSSDDYKKALASMKTLRLTIEINAKESAYKEYYGRGKQIF